MSVDIQKLKHLALAQPEKVWRRVEGEPSMKTGERMFYIDGAGGVSCWENGARDRVSAAYIEAACPAAVLELITELEGYRMGAKAEADAGDEARAEVRKLKAENETLRKNSDRYLWFRAQHWDSSAICAVVDPKTSAKLGAYCPSADLLDSAIDTAMRNQAGALCGSETEQKTCSESLETTVIKGLSVGANGHG